jgi:predicted aconitase
MRGEVYLLSRNVKIQGFDSETWGCQIVTSDFVEITAVIRKGNTFMDNVEIYNCSQYDTNKAALRFQGNGKSWSEVRNSAISNGWGIGAYFENSASVKLTNNVFFAFEKVVF